MDTSSTSSAPWGRSSPRQSISLSGHFTSRLRWNRGRSVSDGGGDEVKWGHGRGGGGGERLGSFGLTLIKSGVSWWSLNHYFRQNYGTTYIHELTSQVNRTPAIFSKGSH